jgi:hypothetical protein
MKKKLAGLIACLALLLPQLARAEGWVWMGYYPWTWSDDRQNWLYMWPAGSDGFHVWSYATEQMETIGTVPALPASPQGLRFALTPAAVEPGASVSTVASVDILDSKSDYATIRLAGSETGVDCTWSLAKIASASQMFILRGTNGAACYTLVLNYATDTTGTYFINEPAPEGWSENLGVPTYQGTFVVGDL